MLNEIMLWEQNQSFIFINFLYLCHFDKGKKFPAKIIFQQESSFYMEMNYNIQRAGCPQDYFSHTKYVRVGSLEYFKETCKPIK